MASAPFPGDIVVTVKLLLVTAYLNCTGFPPPSASLPFGLIRTMEGLNESVTVSEKSPKGIVNSPPKM